MYVRILWDKFSWRIIPKNKFTTFTNTLIYLTFDKNYDKFIKKNKIVKFERLVSRQTKPNLKIKESSS